MSGVRKIIQVVRPTRREDGLPKDSSDIETFEESKRRNFVVEHNGKLIPEPMNIISRSNIIAQWNMPEQHRSNEDFIVPDTVNFSISEASEKDYFRQDNNAIFDEAPSKNNNLINTKVADDVVLKKIDNNSVNGQSQISNIILISHIPVNTLFQAIDNQQLVINNNTMVMKTLNTTSKSLLHKEKRVKQLKTTSNIITNINTSKGNALNETAYKKVPVKHKINEFISTSKNFNNSSNETNPVFQANSPVVQSKLPRINTHKPAKQEFDEDVQIIKSDNTNELINKFEALYEPENKKVKFVAIKPKIDNSKSTNEICNQSLSDKVTTAIQSTKKDLKDSTVMEDKIFGYCKMCSRYQTADMSCYKCCNCNGNLHYQCQKCKKLFSSWPKISSHVTTSCSSLNNLNAYKCRYCTFISFNSDFVKKHITESH